MDQTTDSVSHPTAKPTSGDHMEALDHIRAPKRLRVKRDKSGYDPTKCQGTRVDGQQCTRLPVRGATVCFRHGAGAPQVKAAAERRLATLVNPAIGRIARLIADKDTERTSPSVALRACMDVLDRNGIGQGKSGPPPPMFPPVDGLPPGTSLTVTQTASIRVERLTDDELEQMRRLLEKLGVEAPPVIDVKP